MGLRGPKPRPEKPRPTNLHIGRWQSEKLNALATAHNVTRSRMVELLIEAAQLPQVPPPQPNTHTMHAALGPACAEHYDDLSA